ncbi:MAG: hypothetical protein AAGB22_11945, partial [Bacteroidota bacterium]
ESDWLRQRFDPVLIYLARDGRDFVRSAYTRKVYTEQDLQQPLVPRDGDPAAARWDSWSRFEQLCWYWNHTNAYFLERGFAVHQVEPCWKNYAYFKQVISDPIGIAVPEAEWKTHVERPVNTSRQRQRKQWVKQLVGRGGDAPQIAPIPHWTDWSKEQHRMFHDICGETMSKLGYALETV